MQLPSQDEQAENIIVMIRVKPLNTSETSEKRCISVDKDTITVDIKGEPKNFHFDYIAPENATQEEIFEKAGRPLADACMKGYNATVFAYGQTGAGKTFTVQGPIAAQVPNKEERHKLRGLMQRVFDYMFTGMNKNKQDNPNIQYILKCSYLEIYQEVIIDLLDPQAENLHIREDIKRGVYVENLIEETAESVEDLLEVVKRGKANRHVGATSMNKESSRSHSVLTLTLESKTMHDRVQNVLSSRFHIIDLAGSERQKLTDTAGEKLKEAGKINKSLSALGNVINSLVDISQGKSRHIHYRDSKLTFLLKDSLGGNSKTVIIANIAQNNISLAETLSTLNFAKRAKMIKNKAVVNEDATGTVLLLQQEIRRLKAEIVELKAKCTGTVYKSSEQSDLEVLLQNTIELRTNDVKLFEQLIKEKDNGLSVLKKSIKRCQHTISRDKMILKLKEAALAKLQEGKNLQPNEEMELLRAENQSLREKEEEALSKIAKFALLVDMKDQLMEKNNEQNEYITQMSNFLKTLVEEKEAMKKENIKEAVAKVKIECGEKLEELSRKYIE